MAEKQHINLVFIGHVDHGKSTLVGRTFYDTGNLSEQDKVKYDKLAEEYGKPGFGFAYMMDTVEEERKRGVTIDLSYKKFDTQKNSFTIIDAPGHQDFVKNMITGTSQADAAVLVVAAGEGMKAQTKEHAQLSKVLGVGQLVVALNKMDTINYDEAKYKERVEELSKALPGYGWKDYKVVPVSALKGDNVAKKSESMPWYNGPTLVEALDELKAKPPATDKPLRLPIQDVYNIKGVGTVPVGRVESGVLKPNDKIIVMPSGKTGEVKSVEAHHEQLPQANPGDNVGFNVRGWSRDDIKRGDVVGHENNPPTVAEEFTAQIVVLNHPKGVAVGYTPVFHLHTLQVACTITQMLEKIDPKTGTVVEQNPTFLKNGDSAKVIIKPTVPIVVEKVQDFPSLGRFAIRDMGQTVAAGVVLDVKKKA
ncbi:MAG: translation elongation factor EF-1 subunit alpha [Candidatus Diapherotrites archaeon]|nr:translation elongation factor EF-1 subunit alpha [Candidatus Diapherotrites archaeon]